MDIFIIKLIMTKIFKKYVLFAQRFSSSYNCIIAVAIIIWM